MTRTPMLLAMLALTLTTFARAADPPNQLNYQGVLRNSDDQPLNGTYPMAFRFFDDQDPAPPENEILVDTQGGVTASGGLFNVKLGSGTVTDGSGPGTFTTLTDVFARHTDLYLEVEVDGETLSPRIPVAAAGFALNARKVRGEEIVSGDLDLYVDNAISGCGGGGCSDDNDGLTLATAKLTIQAAINAIPYLLNGDATVHIQSGTYNERLFIERRLIGGDKLERWLTSEAQLPDRFGSIVLLGEPGVVLTGAGLPDADLGDGITVLHWATEIVDIEIREFASGSGLIAYGGALVTMIGCQLNDNSNGLAVEDGAFVSVIDTSISAGGGTALDITTNGTLDVEGDFTISGPIDAREGSTVLFRDLGTCTINADITCGLFGKVVDPCGCTTTTGSCGIDSFTNFSCCTDDFPSCAP